uniref:Uncharacterized protein n=1 Tax=Timema shepardi TaxID=629360 RepID=A0A7R9AX98_TIMSH|nr:unnamed protein product [Timema shepardi]
MLLGQVAKSEVSFQEVTPKYGYPGKCWDKELRKAFNPGDDWVKRGQCAEFSCNKFKENFYINKNGVVRKDKLKACLSSYKIILLYKLKRARNISRSDVACVSRHHKPFSNSEIVTVCMLDVAIDFFEQKDIIVTIPFCGIQSFSRSMGCIVKVNTTVEYPECCPIHYCPKSKSSRFEHTIKHIPQDLTGDSTEEENMLLFALVLEDEDNLGGEGGSSNPHSIPLRNLNSDSASYQVKPPEIAWGHHKEVPIEEHPRGRKENPLAPFRYRIAIAIDNVDDDEEDDLRDLAHARELNRPLGDELPISDLEDSDNDGGDADFVLSDHQSDSEQSEVSDSESTDEDGESVPRDVYRGKDTVPPVDYFRDKLVPSDHFELLRSTVSLGFWGRLKASAYVICLATGSCVAVGVVFLLNAHYVNHVFNQTHHEGNMIRFLASVTRSIVSGFPEQALKPTDSSNSPSVSRTRQSVLPSGLEVEGRCATEFIAEPSDTHCSPPNLTILSPPRNNLHSLKLVQEVVAAIPNDNHSDSLYI